MKKKVYFIGAGGIGMAALERYCLSRGMEVAGYDRTPTELTDALEKEGVEITFDDSVDSVPEQFKNPDETLVVYTPAVKDDHRALKWFRQSGFEVIKRSKFLGEITKVDKSLCFSGTHGKTTTSSMAAHILNLTPGAGCNAFLGGILKNYDSNVILNDKSELAVIEADEFDRSFHTLTPYVAVVTSTDPDHLDIYGNEENYLESFAHFTSLIKPGGFLLIHTGLKLKPRTGPEVKTYTYSSDDTPADFMALNIKQGEGKITFDLKLPDGTTVKDIALGLPVDVNVDNAVAACGAVWLAGKFNEEAIKEALLTFQGSKRRFDIRWKENDGSGRVIIDDYAHHPKELEASIKSIKSLYPHKHLTVAFQPHLYTRTRDFADEFAACLSAADTVALVNLYPAREEPIPGISSKTIFDKIKSTKKYLIEKESFPELIKSINFEILLTVGAGDLPDYIPELINLLENTND